MQSYDFFFYIFYKNAVILEFLAPYLAYFYDISFLFVKNVVILHPISQKRVSISK